jgi:hypothetical protein
MKPLPLPDIPGSTPAERMSNALRTVLKVPKETILRAEAREQRKRERKRERKNAADY